MRKILLLAIVMIGYYLPSYSQSLDSMKNNQFQLGTNYGDFSIKNSIKKFGMDDSIHVKGWIKDSLKDKKYSYPQLSEKNLGFNKKTTGKQLQLDNMPIYKPKGNFTMPIYEPDSAISYTLLIK